MKINIDYNGFIHIFYAHLQNNGKEYSKINENATLYI